MCHSLSTLLVLPITLKTSRGWAWNAITYLSLINLLWYNKSRIRDLQWWSESDSIFFAIQRLSWSPRRLRRHLDSKFTRPLLSISYSSYKIFNIYQQSRKPSIKSFQHEITSSRTKPTTRQKANGRLKTRTAWLSTHSLYNLLNVLFRWFVWYAELSIWCCTILLFSRQWQLIQLQINVKWYF